MGVKKVRKTQEEFEKDVYNLVGDDYQVLSEYKNNKEKVTFLHKTCGRTFEMAPYNFLYSGQRCSKCNSNFGKITLDDVKEVATERGLECLEDQYINRSTKMKCRCLKCNDIFYINFADMKYKGNGCAKCAGNKKLTFEFVVSEFAKEGVTVLSSKEDYKNVHSNLLLKHECGFKYRNNYNNFRNGQRCPRCSARNAAGGKSMAVLFIINILLENGIDFETEKKFPDLKDKRSLRYDFYLKDYNLLIEYNGSQHFKISEMFNEEYHENMERNYQKKIEYAKENGYDFLELNYNENPIQKLADKLNLKLDFLSKDIV